MAVVTDEASLPFAFVELRGFLIAVSAYLGKHLCVFAGKRQSLELMGTILKIKYCTLKWKKSDTLKM